MIGIVCHVYVLRFCRRKDHPLCGFFYQDIRKFFGVVNPGKKPECGIGRKEKSQNKERNAGVTSTLKESKVSIILFRWKYFQSSVTALWSFCSNAFSWSVFNLPSLLLMIGWIILYFREMRLTCAAVLKNYILCCFLLVVSHPTSSREIGSCINQRNDLWVSGGSISPSE